jgi:small subunit ribosomal protein S16
MLAIRMQRSGRKGHAMFRVVVQDSRRTPTSGKLVAQLGSYDPHAKTVIVDKDKAQFYLNNGAQPSERVARLLKSEGVTLPKWVETPETKKRAVRNADKRRSTRPAAPVEETPVEVQPVEAVEQPEAAAEPDTANNSDAAAPVEEKPVEEAAEAPTEDTTEPAEKETAPSEEETPPKSE